MTPPGEPLFVCPPSSPVDVDMVSAFPLPSLQVVDNDVVEALRAELAKCKLDHEREMESVRREHAREVHGLKANIDELTEHSLVNNVQQNPQTVTGATGGGPWVDAQG